jgi:acyl-CoA synthetase (AMP-forming)/AMP-acid ligase II
MMLQFACSKAGLILYNLSPDDPTPEKLKQALTLSQANVLIQPETWDDTNYIRVAERTIPEVRIFDFDCGMPFISPNFPHLRFPCHTGFDNYDKQGFIRFEYMLVPSDNLHDYVDLDDIDDDTPLKGNFILDDKGVPTDIDYALTNEQVLESNVWPSFTKIVNREMHDIHGIGVIF